MNTTTLVNTARIGGEPYNAGAKGFQFATQKMPKQQAHSVQSTVQWQMPFAVYMHNYFKDMRRMRQLM